MSDGQFSDYEEDSYATFADVPAIVKYISKFMDQIDRKDDRNRIRMKYKQDSATAEHAMNRRTRMIVNKFINRKTITQINGCISTGKEANVYHATSRDFIDCAIKIYNTSILKFKNGSEYNITEDHRFKNQCNTNLHKMAPKWARKEMRNLTRMSTVEAKLSVPKPILLRSHVLIMTFIGEDGWPSPNLKNAEFSQSTACRVYQDCIKMMWNIFNICKLVLADFSEFNILYHQGNVVINDVSQSVGLDHPNADEFLRKNCANILTFFRKKGLATLTVDELFDFIKDPTIGNLEHYLEKFLEKAALIYPDFDEIAEQVQEEAFEDMLPNRLAEDRRFRNSARPKNESPDSKKARKRAVKQIQRQRRNM